MTARCLASLATAVAVLTGLSRWGRLSDGGSALFSWARCVHPVDSAAVPHFLLNASEKACAARLAVSTTSFTTAFASFT